MKPIARVNARIGRAVAPPGRSTTLPMIGREQLLRRVVQAFSTTLDGGRTMVTVVGERGSGRSRILREVSALPELVSALIIELRLDDGARDVATALERAIHDTLVLRRSFAVSTLHSGQPTALTTTAADWLSACGAVAPLVILVDDLDTDAQAGMALGGVLRSIDAPWLVIAACEPATAPSAMIAGRMAEARMLELSCERFDHETVAALLRALLAVEPEPCDVAWLVEKTHGLPLLLREAIEAAVYCGAFVEDGERLRRVDTIARASDEYTKLLPLSVPALQHLEAVERTALASAALLGERVPESLLEELSISDADLSTLMDWDLLRSDGETISFESALAHEAALAIARAESLDERHAATLLRLVPSAIDRGLRPPSVTIEALVRIVPEADRARLVADLLDKAATLVSHNEYGYAGVLMAICNPLADVVIDDRVRIGEWFEQYVTVLYALGRSDEQRRAVEEFLQSNPIETAPPELVPAIVRAMLWRVEYFERGKLIEPALDLLDRVDGVIVSMGAGDDASALRNRAMMGRARIYSVAERHDEAFTVLRQLLDEIDIEAQLPVAFDALLVFGRAARTPGQHAEAEVRITAMLERFEREGRERLAVQMRAARLGLHTGDPDFDRFEPEIRTLLEQTRRVSLPRTETNTWVWLSFILADRGEYDEALLAIDRAIEIRRRVGSIALWQLAMITRAQILARARRDEEALSTIAQIELDAETYGRPLRRFLIDVTRCLVAIRRGECQGGAEALGELAEIGRAEGFAGVESSLLEAEGEMLLYTHAIDRDHARGYARRVLAIAPQSIGMRRLLPVALAIMARAHDDAATTARGRSGASDPIILELRRLVTESLSLWLERRAAANVEHALSLLRAHAPRALSADDLTPIDRRLPYRLDGPSWHHCDVQTFGTMRVTDAAGSERGGRHFGQHKSDSKPKKMLAALAVAAILGRRLKRERLIDMVWGESVAAEAAVNNFHVTLSGLRQVVGDVVDFDGVSYTLNTSLVRVDAIRLIAMVEEAMAFQRSGLLFRTYELLRQAMILAAGEFLEGIYDEWTDGARDLVRATIRTARLRIAEIALARGERGVARQEIGELLALDEFDEEAQFLHLSVFRAEGERMRALQEYDRFAERLLTEFESEPSIRLRSLRASLLADG